MTRNPLGWFDRYDGRQTIKGGAKEGTHVSQVHHVQVASEAGLVIQGGSTRNRLERCAGGLHNAQASTVPDRFRSVILSRAKAVPRITTGTG